MTNEQIDRMSKSMTDSLRPYYEEVIKREVANAVHAAKMEILTDIGEETIRKMIREAVRGGVSVEVSVK